MTQYECEGQYILYEEEQGTVMDSIKNKLVIKALAGAVMGMLISLIIHAVNISNGELITDAPFFITQFVGSGLMGAVCMGSSVVYDIESWSLVKVTITHYAIAMIAFLTASLVLKWFNGTALLIAIATFSVAYALIWLFEYLLWKKEIRKMNRDLKILLDKEGIQ